MLLTHGHTNMTAMLPEGSQPKRMTNILAVLDHHRRLNVSIIVGISTTRLVMVPFATMAVLEPAQTHKDTGTCYTCRRKDARSRTALECMLEI